MIWILFFTILLFFLIIWKKEILKYYKNVIYKNSIQKTIFIRAFKEQFTFKMLKISTNFLTKNFSKKEKNLKNEEDTCLICFENKIEILLYPCNHFLFCSDCAKNYINDKITCPICKKNYNRIFKWLNIDNESYLVNEEIFVSINK